jgi:hypothetical protein
MQFLHHQNKISSICFKGIKQWQQVDRNKKVNLHLEWNFQHKLTLKTIM